MHPELGSAGGTPEPMKVAPGYGILDGIHRSHSLTEKAGLRVVGVGPPPRWSKPA